MECRERPEQLLALMRHANAEFLLAYPEDARCRFLRGSRNQLEEVQRFGEGGGVLRILRLEEP
jgi:hypothetical protein